MSVLLCLLVPLVVLAACAPSASPPSAITRDFNIGAYQGEELLGGRETTFSKIFIQGKPVVLNFWAGQCPPCRAEMPAFQKVADEFQGKVIFVGVDVGPFTGLGSHEDAQRLLAELRIRYPAAYAVDAAPLRLYNVRSMPTTVILGPNGQPLQQVDGMMFEQQLRQAVEKAATSSDKGGYR